jgi:hypothetical protein
MRAEGSGEVLELLELLFRHGFNMEPGIFRTLATVWFARRQRGWLLRYSERKDFEVSRWLNAFHVPGSNSDESSEEFGAFVHSLVQGVKEGRYFVSSKLLKRLSAPGRNGEKIYVEHAVPLRVLSEIIERRLERLPMIKSGSSGEVKVRVAVRGREIRRVLERYFTLGWMLASEKKCAVPHDRMSGCVDLLRIRKFERNENGRKNYLNDPRFSRYFLRCKWAEFGASRRGRVLSGFELDEEVVVCDWRKLNALLQQ